MAPFVRALNKARKQPIVANAATAEVQKLLTHFDLQCLHPIVGAKMEMELWFNSSRLNEKQDWEEVICTRAVKCTPNYTNRYHRLIVTIILDEKTNYGVVCEFRVKKGA